MYKLLRDTHLVLGLLSAVFLLAYGASAAQMAYPIHRPPWITTTEAFEIPPGVELEPRPLARWLMDERGMHGDLTRAETTSTAVSITILRPATRYDVTLDRAARKAEVKKGVTGFIGMLNRLHHTGGLWHDDPIIDAWGAFLAAVSVFLLILPVTGVFMWFVKHAKHRRSGAIVLCIGLAWGLGLLVLVRSA
jgi:hypothetical protein